MASLPSLQYDDDVPMTVREGPVVGHYRLGAEIGRGAMARVHDAVSIVSGERAAVKVLNAQCRSLSEVVARFVREGRALQKMTHPNIVRVVDHGVTDEGDAWIAMERLSGVSLADLVAQGPLPEVRALRLMTGVAKALASVHARGMVHRDLKPENVFVVDAGTPAEDVKLIDFGVARVSSEDMGEHSVEYTALGSILGSIAFMAPELLDGSGREPTPAADVFSFAVTLYEAIAGRLPFAGATIAEQLQARRRGAAVALDARTTGGVFSPGLAAFLLRALGHDPDGRPQDGLELLHALYAIQGRAPSFRPSAPPRGMNLVASDGLASLRAGSASPAPVVPSAVTAPAAVSSGPPSGLYRSLVLAVIAAIVVAMLMALWVTGMAARVVHVL